MSDYQVIVIGGRPAGASLAIRLGQRNIKTLLVDKMTLPSLPAVATSPIAYPHHIEAAIELGIPESELFLPGGRIDHFCVTFLGHFDAALPIAAAETKFPYAYGVDRTRFDTAMWEHAARQSSVTARSGFSVTGVVKENGRVVGIKGQTERGKEETFTADLVVGADGRFSPAANMFGAPVIEEHNDHITSSYNADWENVGDDVLPNAGRMYNTAKGFAVIMFPIDTRKYIVGTYMHPKHLTGDKSAEDRYMEALQSIPEVWARLKHATRTTPVVGVKGIKNGMRKAAGEGWALVGDAFHYKDPLDGQGIYDALLEAKLLDESISEYLSGAMTWEQAGEAYSTNAIAATRPMMLQTVARVKKEMFSDPPPFIIRTLIRWLLNSPEYQRDFLRLLTRQSDPARWETPGVMRRAILTGIRNSLFRRSKPASPPVLAEQPS